MKTLATDFDNHLAGDVTSLAMCWKITRKDSLVFGFTSLDTDLVVGGLTYKAATGVQPSAVASTAGMEVDNLDVGGLLDSDVLTESDLLAGLWNGAAIEIFVVNWKAPADGIGALRKGVLGEVKVNSGRRFSAEIRGLSQMLQQPVGSKYSKTCRATLGDSKCGVNLASHTVTGSVTSVSGNRVVLDAARTEASGFKYGKLTFTSGACSGLAMEVYAYATGQIELLAPMVKPIAVGDTYTLTRGCDKGARSDCKNTFNNIINFQGEPDIPSTGKALAYP